jgi:hypothetical protein
MAWLVEIVQLDVGQGMGGFAYLYDSDTGKAEHTILIDLGSDHPKPNVTGPSIEWVVAALKQYMTQPTIDLVILSHSDSDHISLIQNLLKAFLPYDPDIDQTGTDTLYVGAVVYTGYHDMYEKPGIPNVLNELERYMVANSPQEQAAESIEPDYSSFDPDSGMATAYRTVGPMTVYFLAGNVGHVYDPPGYVPPKPRKENGLVTNTKSLVTVLSYYGGQIVMPGDATSLTMKACNNTMSPVIKQNHLNRVLITAAPHHGAKATAFAGSKTALGGITSKQNLENYASNLRANSIFASAGEVGNYKHPYAEVLRYFWDRLVADPEFYWAHPGLGDRHFYTAYFQQTDRFERIINKKKRQLWPGSPAWYTVQTAANVFTNSYYVAGFAADAANVVPPNTFEQISVPRDVVSLPATLPVRGVAWLCVQEKPPGLGPLLFPVTNRDSLLRLRAAILAGVSPDKLPEVPLEDVEQHRSAVRAAQEQRAAGRAPTPADDPPPALVGGPPPAPDAGRGYGRAGRAGAAHLDTWGARSRLRGLEQVP